MWTADLLIGKYGAVTAPSPLTRQVIPAAGMFAVWKTIEDGNYQLFRTIQAQIECGRCRWLTGEPRQLTHDLFVNMLHPHNGMNILHYAAFYNRAHIVNHLLQCYHIKFIAGKGDIPPSKHYANLYTREGFSPLGCAIASSKDMGEPSRIGMEIKKCAPDILMSMSCFGI